MSIEVQQHIDAPPERVWDIITDIENAADHFSGIVSIDVLEKPADGLVGLKWSEKRIMFGKEATEVMWVTDVDPGRSYDVRAENHGMIYLTRMSVEANGSGSTVRMAFSGKPVTLGARLMSVVGWLFSGSLRKALQKDLDDVRALAEAG